MTDFDRFVLDVPPFLTSGWRIEPVLLRATRDGDEHQIEPKLMAVLCVLAQRQGEVVTRGDLFDTVWPDTIVSDDNLTRAVSMLRRLFGDTAQAQRVIETVPRVGYRLLAPVAWDLGADPVGGDSLPALPVVAGPVAEPAPHRRRTWGLALAGAVALVAGAVAMAGRGAPLESVAPRTPKRVTSDPGAELLARLSPDGRHVVYAKNDGASRTDLYVVPVEGGESRQLTTTGGAIYSTWSPDGETIAFVDVQEEACHVALVSALGGPARDLAPCPGDAETFSAFYTLHTHPALDWSPDGQHLASAARTEAETALVLIDAASGEAREIEYERVPGARDAGPRFSPDGRALLFARTYSDGTSQLATVRLGDGRVTPLGEPGGETASYDWVDDRTVLFATGYSDHAAVWTRTLGDDGPPTYVPLTRAGGRPDVAGGRLLLEQWSLEGGLYAVPSGEPFAPRSAFDALPSFSPDGARVAFVSDWGGTRDVWVADASGQRARPVTEGLDILPDTPRWSPDGQRLVFAALVEGDPEVFVLDRIGEPARRIAQASSSERMPSWSPDGRWIYAVSERDGGSDLWRLSPDGSVMERLTTTGVAAGLASPDGAWLYTVRTGEPGLWRRPLGGEDDVLVHPAHGLSWLETWVPAVGGVYLTETRPDRTASVLWIPTDGEPEEIGALERKQDVQGLTVDPSGRVLIGRVDRAEADLAVVSLDGPGRE